MIRVFKKDVKEPEVVEDIAMGNIDKAYEWMEQNRGELYSLYELKCVLDLS